MVKRPSRTTKKDKKMKILHVVGARPNFMKIAPIMHQMKKYPDEFKQILVHTGQHYNDNMSSVFFNELELPRPDINLGEGSGSHALQTATILLRFESVVLAYKPDWVFVPGDVNSTLACALVCCKLGIKVAHVEAGLRSFDRTMPEEYNRLITDQIADLLLTPSRDANRNLLREGIAPEKIHFVGNVMIDTLLRLLPKANERWPSLQKTVGNNKYVLLTLHRPMNVDNPERLQEIMLALDEISEETIVVFPIHPRTRKRIYDGGFGNPVSRLGTSLNDRLRFIEPLGYLDFLALQAHAALVLTDSGGVQEETTFLGIPCLTLRSNTERPITIEQGTNQLISYESSVLTTKVMEILSGSFARNHSIPELWDGNTSKRIVRLLRSNLNPQ
jgi:UDP-N-acetylglucosamine 2-epimerase (non-hydrolysing)